MKNKKGSAMVTIFMVIGVVLLAAIAFGVYQTQVGGSVEEKTVTGDCDTLPSIVLTVLDEINPGTALSGSANNTLVDGTYRGSSIPGNVGFGQDVEILVDGTAFIAVKGKVENAKCGTNDLNLKTPKVGIGTLKVFNDNTNPVSNTMAGDGAVNQSASSTPVTQKIVLTVPSDLSVGELLCIAEANNNTYVKDMTLSSAGATVTPGTVPQLHNPENTTFSSVSRAWDVTGVGTDGKITEFFLNIEPKTSQTIDNTAMMFTCYTKQWFVETDSSFQYGVENLDGTNKSAANFDFDWLIT